LSPSSAKVIKKNAEIMDKMPTATEFNISIMSAFFQLPNFSHLEHKKVAWLSAFCMSGLDFCPPVLNVDTFCQQSFAQPDLQLNLFIRGYTASESLIRKAMKHSD